MREVFFPAFEAFFFLFPFCISGAEVYERLNRHREEEKARRKLLDDILLHIQVMTELCFDVHHSSYESGMYSICPYCTLFPSSLSL